MGEDNPAHDNRTIGHINDHSPDQRIVMVDHHQITFGHKDHHALTITIVRVLNLQHRPLLVEVLNKVRTIISLLVIGTVLETVDVGFVELLAVLATIISLILWK